MDHFGMEEYRELIDLAQAPAVSIFIASQRQDIKGKNNQLAFRAQVERAKKLLATHYPDAQLQSIAHMMDRRLQDTSLWGSLTQGAAAFFGPGVDRVYRLDTPTSTETVVSDTFHTRPLLRTLLEPQHYWVLVLDPKQTRLYEVSGRQIQPVHMGAVATNVEGAIDQPYPPQQQDRNRQMPSGGQDTSVHGFGPGRDVRPNLLRQFAQVLDTGLRDMLQGNTDPIILCGLEQISSIFRSVTRLENLGAQGLLESVTHLSANEILEKTRPLAGQFAEQKIAESLAVWEREYGRGLGEIDLQQIARRTLMGQVRILFIEQGRRVYGTLDRNTGEITLEQPNGDAVEGAGDGQPDILDDLAEFVIARGGEALVLPAERMPSQTGAAAVLRGIGSASEVDINVKSP